MIRLGLNLSFGVVHVLWLDLVVVVPVAGLGLLASARLRRRARLVVAGVLALLLAPVGAYASFIEPSRTLVERADVPLAPERAGDRPVRIAVVSDLQFEELGGHEREAVDTVMAQRPDVILITGDIHHGSSPGFARQRAGIRKLLSRLRAPGGVYAVQGDSESLVKARLVYAGTGIRLLVNRAVPVRVNGRALSVAGIELNYRSARAAGTIGALERTPGRQDVRILRDPPPRRGLRAPPPLARRPDRGRPHPRGPAPAAVLRPAADRVARAPRGGRRRPAHALGPAPLRQPRHRHASGARRPPCGWVPHPRCRSSPSVNSASPARSLRSSWP